MAFVNKTPATRVRHLPMADNVTIAADRILEWAGGYVQEWSAEADPEKFAGVSVESGDNTATGHAAGAVSLAVHIPTGRGDLFEATGALASVVTDRGECVKIASSSTIDNNVAGNGNAATANKIGFCPIEVTGTVGTDKTYLGFFEPNLA